MNLKKIRIGKRDLPIRIDYNVIEIIEDEYDTLEKFRMELLGFYYKREDDGSYILGEEGTPEIGITKPSIKAIKFILPLMINEGLKAQAYDQHKEYEPLDPEGIIMECEIDKTYLIELIEEEIGRAYRIKKINPGEENGKSRKK